MTKGKPSEMTTHADRATRLAALMGKSVAEQANAGYSQMWKRSATFLAVKTAKGSGIRKQRIEHELKTLWIDPRLYSISYFASLGMHLLVE